MSRRLVVRPEAEVDITHAFAWYEQRVIGLGHDFLLQLDALLHAIQRAPQHYPRVYKTIRRALTRRFPYQVFFLENDEQVVVLAVLHALRDPQQ